MDFIVPAYDTLVRPTFNRSRGLWSHFGFPANEKGMVLTRRFIVCVICESPRPLPFDPLNDSDGDQLREHLRTKHLAIYRSLDAPASSNGVVQRSKAAPQEVMAVSNTRSSPRQQADDAELGRIECFRPCSPLYYYGEECGDVEPAVVEESAEGEDADLVQTTTAGHDGDEPVMIEYLMGEEPVVDEQIIMTDTKIKVGTKRSIVETVDAGVQSSQQHQQQLVVKRPKIEHNLCRKLAEVCADDILRPDIWDGNAMSQLLRDLCGRQRIPDAAGVCAEMRQMHNDIIASQAAKSVLPFALCLERWSNIEQNMFFTLSIVRHTKIGPEARSLCTWPQEKNAIAIWTPVIDALDLRHCQAVVLNFELPMTNVPAFVTNRSLPIVHCMASACEWAARLALRLVPQYCLDALGERAASSSSSDCWMTQIERIEQWTREQKDINPHTASVVTKLERIVECLQPLRIAMETLRLEDRPGASLSLPLAQQLVANHFAEGSCEVEDDDAFAAVLKQMKTAVRFSFDRVILKNPFLAACSYLDPRFHALADAAAIDDIQATIRALCPASKTAVPAPPNPPTAIATPSAPAKRPAAKVGLSFFFASAAAAASNNRANPPPPPIDLELQKYAAADALPFDQCPREWWQDQTPAYPILVAAARPLWSVPAMMPTANASPEHARRRWLRSADEIGPLLAVHDDRRLLRQTTSNTE